MNRVLILPETYASTSCPPSISTLNIALGKASITVPSNSILSSFAINFLVMLREHERTVFGYRNRMLEMSRQRAVYRYCRPSVA